MDIVILGGKITNLICAQILKYHGLKVHIIMDRSLEESEDLRNIHLTLKTKVFFENLNLWTDLERYSNPLDKVYVVDNQNENIFELDPEYIGNNQYTDLFRLVRDSLLGPKIKNFKNTLYNLFSNNHELDLSTKSSLGYMIRYKDLYNYFAQKIENDKDIIKTISEYGLVKDENIFKIKLKSEMIEPKFIIANCHKIRKSYLDDYEYFYDHNQKILSFDIYHERPHLNAAIEHFMVSGTFASLPSKNPNISSIVWCLKKDMYKYYTSSDDFDLDKISNDIYEKIGLSYGEIKIISSPELYDPKTFLNKKYFQNNLILIGDSIHFMHPLAGLGLNQCIKDLKLLCPLIARCALKNLSSEIITDVLTKYQNIRSRDNLSVAKSFIRIDEIFNHESSLLMRLRHFGFYLSKKLINNAFW